jgi:hypothetical protein
MAMTDDPFFRRLRHDAGPLRHQPDQATLARIRASIESQIARMSPRTQPTVAELLAAWFRPLAATAAALALAAALVTTLVNRQELTIGANAIEISMGGETWRVGG